MGFLWKGRKSPSSSFVVRIISVSDCIEGLFFTDKYILSVFFLDSVNSLNFHFSDVNFIFLMNE